MLKIIRFCVWFVLLNFGVCNQIWKDPVSYWCVIECIVVALSLIMTLANGGMKGEIDGIYY